MAVVLIRANMAAIDQRARSLSKFATDHGLGFSSTDPFELSGLPFEVITVRGGVRITNVVYGRLEDLPVVGFDLLHTTSVGQTTVSQFVCSMTQIAPNAPPMVVARRTSGPVVGGAPAVATESGEFDRRFVVRCDDRRFALAALDPALMAWLLEASDEPSFELAGNLLLCYVPRNKARRPDAAFRALRECMARLPASVGTARGTTDSLFARASWVALPRGRRPIRISSILIGGVVAAVVIYVVLLLAVAFSFTL